MAPFSAAAWFFFFFFFCNLFGYNWYNCHPHKKWTVVRGVYPKRWWGFYHNFTTIHFYHRVILLWSKVVVEFFTFSAASFWALRILLLSQRSMSNDNNSWLMVLILTKSRIVTTYCGANSWFRKSLFFLSLHEFHDDFPDEPSVSSWGLNGRNGQQQLHQWQCGITMTVIVMVLWCSTRFIPLRLHGLDSHWHDFNLASCGSKAPFHSNHFSFQPSDHQPLLFIS